MHLPISPTPPLSFRFVAAALGRLADAAPDNGVWLGREEWAGLDWTDVLATAARHRVEAALAHVLSDAGWRGVPDAVRADLGARQRSAALRGMMQAAELDRIATALHGQGIPFFVLKGAPLGHALFGSAVVRQSKDIDILVGDEDLERAIGVLQAQGFDQLERERDLARTPRQRATWMRMKSDISFASAKTKTIVELHWRPAAPELMPFDMKSVWPDRTIVRPGRADLPILPSMQQFLYLACHGAGHAWFRLKWLLDTAALLNRSSGAELEAICEAAARQRLDAVVGSTLLLSADLLAARVDPERLGIARSDRRTRRLVRYAMTAMLRPDSHEYSTLLIVNRLNMKGGFPYLKGVARGTMYCAQDWEDFPLPDRLFPLYAVLRPLGWAKRRAGL